ncbi:MAG: valine--tRNA ligase, partial [Bacilli bacterium]
MMLDKKYNHTEVEKGKYEKWKSAGYFNSGDLSKEPYCIVIPPPNVTGKLHLGHAWDTAIQDIIIRYKRMKGFDCLWLPGMDHAGIATQSKVDARLRSEGINPRELTREAWLEHAWSWKKEYADTIHSQWARLGLSLDYNKERFTLDEGLNRAVRKVFVDLYNKGLIYRGERIINWDPVQMTALSSEEVIYKEDKGAFYHIKYFIEGTDEYLDVATTRPETLFGDTAVAVNPKDERYLKYVGKNVVLPVIGKLIPIITDEHADPEFGTGVVKITPAHDPNDFEVGLRHNLERVIVMNPDATMNEKAGKYQGMTREKCREALLEDLEKDGLLISVEEMTHSVGHSERSDAVIEPYLSKQWFVKMRPLADAVLANQKNKDTKVNFVPSRYEKIMNHWMEITYDWCISRQLWWGHRIPVWYRGEEVYCGMEAPTGEGWVQDPDVLDTWFSSALWPFSTLGWPEKTKDIERYFPNNCLVTGYDIIPFWVNRMTFQSLEFTGKRPFKDCLIHGLIRDKLGRKFSKSLGNGVDPMDMCEEYGADSLRYYLTTTAANGTDIRFDEEKIKATWNFINKLWNATRFVLLNIEDLKEIKLDNLTLPDKWILSKYQQTVKEVTKYMEKYEFNNAANAIYNFTWSLFCDNYIEMSKFNLSSETTKSVLCFVLTGILKMLQPFMPFVTDELYNALPVKDEESIMISSYPEYNKKYLFDTREIDTAIEFITLFRNKIKELNIKNYQVINHIDNQEVSTLILNMLKLNDKVASSNEYSLKETIKLANLEIEVLYNDEIDYQKELENLLKEKEKLEKSIERRKNLLANENYVNKAPANVVENDRLQLAKEESRL